ncbi:MAG TPA: glutathione binding-like protein [Rubrivivax sp.]|nr:glutathione binding-like protein [Rubrivivax sp.]
MLALTVLDWTADGGCGKHREFLAGWVTRVLQKLERWLAGREFVATGEFTVADILMAHVLSDSLQDKALLAPYSGVTPYRDRCLRGPRGNRPATRTAHGSKRDRSPSSGQARRARSQRFGLARSDRRHARGKGLRHDRAAQAGATFSAALTALAASVPALMRSPQSRQLC